FASPQNISLIAQIKVPIPLLQEANIHLNEIYPNNDSISEPSSSRIITKGGVGNCVGGSGGGCSLLGFFFFFAEPPDAGTSLRFRGVLIFPVGGKRGLAGLCFIGRFSSS